MLRITFAILILLSSIACSLNASNKKVKKQLTPTRFEQRVNELIAQMTLDEKISQLMNGSDGIERLGILPYDWWNEALHGVARNGRATVFPQAIGMAATTSPPPYPTKHVPSSTPHRRWAITANMPD